jgi:hypothetical protein
VIVIFVAAVSLVMIFSRNTFHFHELTVNYYTDGTMDFSADASALVRSLGVISLMTLIFGLAIGSAISLTTSKLLPNSTRIEENVDGYEKALMESGFVRVTKATNGTTYQITELGQRFLRDYAFLKREIDDLKVPAGKIA